MQASRSGPFRPLSPRIGYRTGKQVARASEKR